MVVILDGLDEATGWTPGQGLFSADPPDGLRVLVTARTGPGDIAIGGWATTLGWANPQLAIITTLSGLDRRGVEDALVSVGNPLDKLATKVDVVGELHRLSEGDPLLVRLYVDALVAQPQRLAALSAEDMHTIQPGLKGYIERWWQDQREQWRIEGRNPITEQGHLRLLLNAIAASLGPLTLDDLAALHSDLTDSTLLHELLEHVRRWLVGDGKQQGYSYTHPRLGYFFWEQLSSHEQRAWNERFVGWGTRILTDLNSGALPSNFAPRYLLQNYAAHLRRAQAPPAQFYALISDGWRKARGELDITDGRFLNDVERAWEQAKQSYNLTTSGKGVALIQQVKAMLCQASRIALGSNLQPRLLAQMVQFGLYTPTQALAIAKLAPTEIERSHQLQALAPFLSEVFLSEALAAARSIRDEVHRASALCHLAPHLPAASLGEALMAATSFSDEGYRAEVLRSLAPHLSEALLNEGLAVARSIQNKDYRARALSSLAPHLSAELLSEALAGARSIRDGNYRTKALSDLAPHLSPNLLSKALTAARSIRDENYRAEALSKLAPCLPETFRLEVLGEALRAVRSIEKNYGDGDLHICRLRNLALHLPETTRLEVLAEALTIARSIQNEEHRVRALSILVLHLPETRRMEVLNEALTVARSVRYELDRAEAFGNLAPHLPETLRLEVLNEALKAARSLPNRMDFTWVLSSLVPHLPQTLRMEVLGEALTVARSIQDNDHRTIALSSLASHLPVGLLSEIWTMARSIQGGDYRVEALRNLAPRLTKGQLSEALIAATSIRDERCRAEALSSLAPHLPEALFSEGLIAATSIRDDMYRAEALTSLAPHLPQALLSEALIAARSMRGDYRTEVLSSLAPYLSEALRKKVLDEALAVARVGYTEEQRAYALSCLAPHLPEALPKEVLGEILTAVRSSRQGMDRFHALNRLAPHCPHTVRLEVVSEALTAIYAIQGSDYSDFDALGSLLPLLPEMLRREALDEALTRIRSFRLPGSHARALSSLASHLPITWLGELLTAAGSIENDYHNLHWRDLALRNLVKPLIACILQSPELVYSSFVETLPVLASRPRPEFLRDITFLMPVILALAGDEAPQAAEGIYHAVQEVCGWWP